MSTDPLIPALCSIENRTQESGDVFTLDITPSTGTFAFEPGQFNMLYVPGAGESAISISGDPGTSGTLTHTVRAVGNVTRLLSQCHPGDQIGVRGPFGSPWPVKDAKNRDVVIVAGGIGLAPLRPVIYEIARNRSNYRRVTLVYGARTPSDILFQDELLQWKEDGVLNLEVTVDATDATWRGDIGVVTHLIGRAKFAPWATIAMICGPEIMMRYSAMELMERGIPARHIYTSMERNMKCAVALCGHCQFGPHFVCKDGPVFTYPEVEGFLRIREF